jgi:hypothetical protein
MSVLVIDAAASGWEGGALDYAPAVSWVIGADADGWQGGALDYRDLSAGASRELPDRLYVHEATYNHRRAQVATISPATYSAQVQDRGGRGWQISLAWDGLTGAAAAELVEFLAFVAVPGHTFTMSLDRVSPGAPAGIVLFGCLQVDPGWESRAGVAFGASLEAVEMVGGVVAESIVVKASTPGWQGGALDYAAAEQVDVTADASGWDGANDSSL